LKKDAALRNAGVGRWINDPRGVKDAEGSVLQHNCTFVVHTPRGGEQRIGAVRTCSQVLKGEELLVKYGGSYWWYVVKLPLISALRKAGKNDENTRSGWLHHSQA